MDRVKGTAEILHPTNMMNYVGDLLHINQKMVLKGCEDEEGAFLDFHRPTLWRAQFNILVVSSITFDHWSRSGVRWKWMSQFSSYSEADEAMGLFLNLEFMWLNTKSSKFSRCLNYCTQIVMLGSWNSTFEILLPFKTGSGTQQANKLLIESFYQRSLFEWLYR